MPTEQWYTRVRRNASQSKHNVCGSISGYSWINTLLKRFWKYFNSGFHISRKVISTKWLSSLHNNASVPKDETSSITVPVDIKRTNSILQRKVMQLGFENTRIRAPTISGVGIDHIALRFSPERWSIIDRQCPKLDVTCNLLLHWLWCQIERTLFADVHHQCRHQDSSHTNWCLDNGWCARSLVAQICPSAQPGARSFSVRGRRRQFSHRSRCYSVRPQPATINRLLDAQSFTDKKRKTIKTI